MKKIYTKPDAEIIFFYTEEIITVGSEPSGECTVVACADDSWL